MGIVSFIVCDICGEGIDPGEPITLVYDGSLERIEGGRAIVRFPEAQGTEPLHHHSNCHQQTHSALPAEEKGLMN